MLKDYLFQDFKLKQDTVFDLGELYKLLFRWFEVNGYVFQEKEYHDYDEPGGKHIEIFWAGEKIIDKYVKFVIEVNYFVLGLTKVELEKGGVKLKTNKGTAEFRISAYLAKDYKGDWGKMPMMLYIYDRFIARHRIDRLEGEILKETNSCIDEIKAFMDIHRF